MDLDITRDIFAIDENNVTSREGSSNGTEMTSFIVSYEEVRRCQVAKKPSKYAKMWLVTSYRGTVSSLPCHCSSIHTCRETITLCLKVHERVALCLGQIEILW
jgi:hypothetical protein